MIVAIVALVIAIGAKNDASDNQTAADATAEQLKTELTDKADKLSAELAKDAEQTSSVGESAKKAQREGKEGPADRRRGGQAGGREQEDDRGARAGAEAGEP